eukprot:13234-Pelagococcus_subviridis.AAC.4
MKSSTVPSEPTCASSNDDPSARLPARLVHREHRVVQRAQWRPHRRVLVPRHVHDEDRVRGVVVRADRTLSRKASGGVERRQGRTRGARRDAKVLKKRRSPRQRGRTGTGVNTNAPHVPAARLPDLDATKVHPNERVRRVRERRLDDDAKRVRVVLVRVRVMSRDARLPDEAGEIQRPLLERRAAAREEFRRHVDAIDVRLRAPHARVLEQRALRVVRVGRVEPVHGRVHARAGERVEDRDRRRRAAERLVPLRLEVRRDVMKRGGMRRVREARQAGGGVERDVAGGHGEEAAAARAVVPRRRVVRGDDDDEEEEKDRDDAHGGMPTVDATSSDPTASASATSHQREAYGADFVRVAADRGRTPSRARARALDAARRRPPDARPVQRSQARGRREQRDAPRPNARRRRDRGRDRPLLPPSRPLRVVVVVVVERRRRLRDVRRRPRRRLVRPRRDVVRVLLLLVVVVEDSRGVLVHARARRRRRRAAVVRAEERSRRGSIDEEGRR